VFFNINILALVVSDILRGPKFTLGGPVPSCTPLSGNFFCTPGEYVIMSYGVFNCNFLSLLLSEILGGPKFTLGGPTPPGHPLSEKFLYQSEYFTISDYIFNFNILALVVSEILGGPKFTLGGPVPPCTLSCGKIFILEASTLLCLMGFLISTF